MNTSNKGKTAMTKADKKKSKEFRNNRKTARGKRWNTL